MSVAIDKLPLRDLKKHRTAQALRETARDYFERVPYDEARLTDIARDAEVSATTVYNYFATKVELLYAVVGEGNDAIIEKAAKLNARDWHDSVDALHALTKLFFRWFDSFQRSALQALLSAALVPRSDAHSQYARIDQLEERALRGLVVALQKQRLIEPTLDPEFLSVLLFNIMNAEFVSFVSDETRTAEVSCASLRRQFEFISSTWAPRRPSTKERTGRSRQVRVPINK
jgi:AcrR family transcriptional regulator